MNEWDNDEDCIVDDVYDVSARKRARAYITVETAHYLPGEPGGLLTVKGT